MNPLRQHLIETFTLALVTCLLAALPIAGRISTDLGYTNAAAKDWLQKWDTTNRVFVTYTNNGGTNWYLSGSRNEPYIGLGEGFILHSATNHTWIQRFLPCSGN